MEGAPEPDATGTPADFVDGLRRLKAWSGLSYRDIERKARAAGERLPASTLASVLSRGSLPHVDLVAVLVRVCTDDDTQVHSWTRARRATAQQSATRAARPTRPAPAATPVPWLLPPPAARFVGREPETRLARRALTAEVGAPLLVTGPAGVGKSTFAVRVGHLVADEFPDGQLYADMHGASAEPTDPAEVLSAFLRALGVRGAHVPAEYAGRLHLYRTLVARRRLLVVLDDAADGAQVRDLVPSGPRCSTVITSRKSLADIDGVRVPLPMLGAAEGAALLRGMVGGARADAEPAAVRAVLRRCGGLPLAVWIAGARLASRPHLSLVELARALGTATDRLDALAVGDIGVRAGLELSYLSLTDRPRRLLRLLALAPTGFADWAAAALLDTGPADAERALDDLLDVHLVEGRCVDGRTRYRLHDLTRAFAEEQLRAGESAADRRAARDRLLGAAVQLAEAGEERLSADFEGRPERRGHWRFPAPVVDGLLGDAQGWFDREHRFLVQLTERGLGDGAELAVPLATALTTHLQLRSHFDDWHRLQTRALRSAVDRDDRPAAVRLHRGLGELATVVDRYPVAVEHFRQALAWETDAEPGRTASAMAGLAYVHRLTGDYAAAEEHFDRAAELAGRAGNARCLAYIRNGLAVVALERGDPAAAWDRARDGLAVSRAAGYRPGEAQALRILGSLHRQRAEFRAAADCYGRAAGISLDLGDRLAATHAECWLGDVLHRLGEHLRGHRLLAGSLAVYRQHANAWGEAAALTCLADAHLAAGRPRVAERRAGRAVAIWQRVASPYWLTVGLDVLRRAQAG